jgi:hypothetical protein
MLLLTLKCWRTNTDLPVSYKKASSIIFARITESWTWNYKQIINVRRKAG